MEELAAEPLLTLSPHLCPIDQVVGERYFQNSHQGFLGLPIRLRLPEALKPSTQALVDQMEQVSPEFGPLYRLTQAFTQMIRAR